MAREDTRPPPVTLINLATEEQFLVDGRGVLRPETSTEKTVVQFSDISPFGLSHTRQQYTGTGNRNVPVTFRLVVFTREDQNRVETFRKFCAALTYSSGDASEALDAGPPLLLVVWTGVLSGVFRVRSLDVVGNQFNKLGQIIDGEVQMSLSEHLERRLTSTEVRELGSFRVRLR